jgi:hypothetical protein
MNTYIHIVGLFVNISTSGYAVSEYGMIWRIMSGKVWEGSGHGLIWGTSSTVAWREEK